MKIILNSLNLTKYLIYSRVQGIQYYDILRKRLQYKIFI